MRILIFLLATLFITGCATPEQRAAQISAEVDDMVRVVHDSYAAWEAAH